MTAPLRLLYLLPAEGFGGAERQGVYHLAELPRHGVRLTSFVGASAALRAELSAAGVSAHRLPCFPPSEPPSGALRLVRGFARGVDACVAAATRIERALEGRRPDLIFANRTFAWLVAALLARRLGVPYVIRAGSRPARPVFGPALSLLDVVARPAAVFYNCAAVERSIAARFDCPAHELPNVVDLERFAPCGDTERRAARALFGLEDAAPSIGLAARPAPEKGFDFFAQVVRQVVARNAGVRFVVAGEFPYRPAYEARFRSLGLGGVVRFLGHVGDVASFFRAVDIVILTSRARSIEASPNALLEAMAARRPIVASAVGGVPELVRHGVEGLLVRDGDAATFAAHLVQLAASPRRRNELGARGRARAAARHRPSVVVERLAQELRDIASLHAAGSTSQPGVPCASNIHSVPLTISSSAGLPSRASSSSPGVAT
jgi:glycosyltransferase involved in cell wall biosynthesis